MRNGAIYLGSLIFALAAFTHLARIFCPFDFSIAHHQLSTWINYVGFVIFGLLSVYLFAARHRSIDIAVTPIETPPEAVDLYPKL